MPNLFRKKKIEDILQEASDRELAGKGMQRSLTVRDLTVFGIAAIIGSGIFSTIGIASYNGGPAVIFLFIGIAIACGFTGLAYAEFASIIPVSGSAYTYSYVAFGELPAWIIGWALIMEYSIGNVTIAISFSDYFTDLLKTVFQYNIPEWMTTDYFTAAKSFKTVSEALSGGKSLTEISQAIETVPLMEGYWAWLKSPLWGGVHWIADLPALTITVLMTAVVFRGIQETRRSSTAMVAFKLLVVLILVVVGAFYINSNNWHPFMPNGVGGVLKGVSAVFFAYIGFDAISTTSEECVQPQRDIPRAIIYCLIICTILYVVVALVITGIVSYKELNVGDPLAYVFLHYPQLRWLSALVSLGGVVAIAGILLVYVLGQPRIWMVMSRDGLLPAAFSKLHPKFKTPYIATIATGLMVGIPTFFLNINFVTDLCSLSTLFAFVLVCAGVIQLRNLPEFTNRTFKSPYINARFIIPALFLLYILGLITYKPLSANNFSLTEWAPEAIFLAVFAYLSVLSFQKNLSFIPVAGVLTCLYMMVQLGWTNWLWFLIWLSMGLVIYFGYSIKHSKLSTKS